jgi:hypothetical protein
MVDSGDDSETEAPPAWASTLHSIIEKTFFVLTAVLTAVLLAFMSFQVCIIDSHTPFVFDCGMRCVAGVGAVWAGGTKGKTHSCSALTRFCRGILSPCLLLQAMDPSYTPVYPEYVYEVRPPLQSTVTRQSLTLLVCELRCGGKILMGSTTRSPGCF